MISISTATAAPTQSHREGSFGQSNRLFIDRHLPRRIVASSFYLIYAEKAGGSFKSRWFPIWLNR